MNYIDKVETLIEYWGWALPVGAKNDIEKLIKTLQEHHQQELIEEYRKGYNQCLRDQKLVGEKYQNLYL